MNRRRGFIKSCTIVLMAVALATGTMAKSCLWKVTSNTGTLYLQGSVHVLKADNYPLAPAIEEAYTASDTLILEVDMKEMASLETQQRIMAKAMLPGTETLQQVLDADTYQELNSACDRAGVPIAALSKFKPWFATMTVTMAQLQKMGFDSQHGLDTYFFGKADADGKKVLGLESVDFQIDLFESLASDNPSDFITHALAELSVIEKDMAMMEKAWETGDIDAVGALITKGFEGYPNYHKTFVLDRNERWLKTMEELLKTAETNMMVVGAGHLSGKGGLLELLKQKGYTLEQL